MFGDQNRPSVSILQFRLMKVSYTPIYWLFFFGSALHYSCSRASDFGLMKIDSTGRVIQFAEKPKGSELKAMVVQLILLPRFVISPNLQKIHCYKFLWILYQLVHCILSPNIGFVLHCSKLIRPFSGFLRVMLRNSLILRQWVFTCLKQMSCWSYLDGATPTAMTLVLKLFHQLWETTMSK